MDPFPQLAVAHLRITMYECLPLGEGAHDAIQCLIQGGDTGQQELAHSFSLSVQVSRLAAEERQIGP